MYKTHRTRNLWETHEEHVSGVSSRESRWSKEVRINKGVAKLAPALKEGCWNLHLHIIVTQPLCCTYVLAQVWLKGKNSWVCCLLCIFCERMQKQVKSILGLGSWNLSIFLGDTENTEPICCPSVLSRPLVRSCAAGWHENLPRLVPVQYFLQRCEQGLEVWKSKLWTLTLKIPMSSKVHLNMLFCCFLKGFCLCFTTPHGCLFQWRIYHLSPLGKMMENWNKHRSWRWPDFQTNPHLSDSCFETTVLPFSLKKP